MRASSNKGHLVTCVEVYQMHGACQAVVNQWVEERMGESGVRLQAAF